MRSMYEQTIRRLCAYQSGRETPKLKGSRYLWLKNPGSLSGLQQERLEQFRSQCLETAKAYQLKLAFQDHTLQTADHAVAYLRHWCGRSRRNCPLDVTQQSSGNNTLYYLFKLTCTITLN